MQNDISYWQRFLRISFLCFRLHITIINRIVWRCFRICLKTTHSDQSMECANWEILFWTFEKKNELTKYTTKNCKEKGVRYIVSPVFVLSLNWKKKGRQMECEPEKVKLFFLNTWWRDIRASFDYREKKSEIAFFFISSPSLIGNNSVKLRFFFHSRRIWWSQFVFLMMKIIKSVQT